LVNNTNKKFGGAEKHMFTFTKLFLENGHQVGIFGSQRFNAKMGYVSRICDICDCPPLADIFKAFQPDIVHLHKINLTLSSSILREIKRFNISVVMTIHYVYLDNWYIDDKNRPYSQEFNIKVYSKVINSRTP